MLQRVPSPQRGVVLAITPTSHVSNSAGLGHSRLLGVFTCPDSLHPASTAGEVSLQRHLVLPPLVAVEVLLPVGVAGAGGLRVGCVVDQASSLEQTVSEQF